MIIYVQINFSKKNAMVKYSMLELKNDNIDNILKDYSMLGSFNDR